MLQALRSITSLVSILLAIMGIGFPALVQATILAYVTNAADDTVSVIDTTTNTVIDTITVGNDPHGAAVHPDSTKAYVTNRGDDTVSVIDTSVNSVTDTIDVGGAFVNCTQGVMLDCRPYGIVINPAETRAYMALRFSDSVSVLDTATLTIIDMIPVGLHPIGIAMHPAGTEIYVMNETGDTVSVIDTASNAVTDTVTVGEEPIGGSVHPDGTAVYIPNQRDNTVSVLDTATHMVTDTISVGSVPKFVAFGDIDLPPPPALSGCLQLQGVLVANSTVRLTQWGEKRQLATTNADGCYQFDTIAPGKRFRLTIQGPRVP